MTDRDVRPVWAPDPQQAEATRMAEFRRAAQRASGESFASTPDVHAWSLRDPAAFWSLVWAFFDVVGDPGPTPFVATELPEARFFPQARINLAENLLAPWIDSDLAAVLVVGESDDGVAVRQTMSGRELAQRVGAFARALRAHGIAPGDRIGLVMPVGVEALVCTLGALAVGAVVSSVSPEFGSPSIVDRLGQLEPKVLVATPSYRWNGRRFDRSENIAAVAAELPSLSLLLVDAPDVDASIAASTSADVRLLAEAMRGGEDPQFERLAFDHPAYVLFSSGTTGKPKCLVHRGGGVLLKHLVELGLHADIGSSDRLLYYTTTSWMMWNWEISCLALGATLILYDGAPAFPTAGALFEAADLAHATHLGLSARLIDHMRSEALDVAGLLGPALRQVLVTGSPLSVPAAQWLAAELGPGIMINPISGGTDLVGVFVGGDPTRPFFGGEMAGPSLGTAVDVYTDAGRQAPQGEAGELVCLQPFPTVPVGIWGDDTGERLHATYFAVWPGVWVHGDRAVRTAQGGIAILGRSDATLNVGGVRIGTAEIYAALADHPAVADALAFGQEWEGDTRIVLLVVPRPGTTLDAGVQASITSAIRDACSPRHVPALVIAVPELPRTQTGKLAEIAVREAVHGREVKGRGALANPECLDVIVASVPR